MKSEKLLVKLGTLSIGESEAGLSMSMNRDGVTLAEAEEMFCGKHLDIALTLGHEDEIPGVEAIQFNSRARVERITVTKTEFSTRLKIKRKECDLTLLADFSSAEAKFSATVAPDEPKEQKE